MPRTDLPPTADLARAAAAASTLCLVGAAVHLLGHRRTQRLLGTVVPLRNGPASDTEVADVLLALDRAGARLPAHGRCLRRSLALWTWLRWRGIPSEVVLGVRREGDGLIGHAWVERGGVPLGEADDVTATNVSFGSG